MAVHPLLDGKYELVELAGEGGMASVYRARVKGAAGFSRTVAIKKIKPEFLKLQNYTDMFIEEARVGSELAHPNIVQVYDFGVDERGSYYLVMEWIDGLDLGSFVRFHRGRRSPTPWHHIVAAGIGTLRGLSAAHERRRADGTPAPIIHRDVSPHNVLIGTNGVAKLTDFGLARARDRMTSLTAPGTVKGKLYYLSPEVAFGGEATPQSDLFAMGALMWECLTGQRLFDGRNDVDVFMAIRECRVRPLRDYRPDVPDELIAVIDHALKREPAERIATASAFATALSEVLRLAPQIGDAQAALGNAVIDVHRALTAMRQPVSVDQIPRVKAPRAVPPPPPPATAPPPHPAAPPAAAPAPSELEFSHPDLSVEPILLTKPKVRDP